MPKRSNSRSLQKPAAFKKTAARGKAAKRRRKADQRDANTYQPKLSQAEQQQRAEVGAALRKIASRQDNVYEKRRAGFDVALRRGLTRKLAARLVDRHIGRPHLPLAREVRVRSVG